MFEWNFGDKILMDEAGLKYLADHAMPLILTKDLAENQEELTFYSQYLVDYLPDDNSRRKWMAMGYLRINDLHIYTSDMEVFPIDIEKSENSNALTLIFPAVHDPATIKLELLCNDTTYEEGLHVIAGHTWDWDTALLKNQSSDGYQSPTINYGFEDWTQPASGRTRELNISENWYIPIDDIDVSHSDIFELTELSVFIDSNYRGGDGFPITEPITDLVCYVNRSNPLVFNESFVEDVKISLYFDFYDANNTLIATTTRENILTRGKFNYYVNNQLVEDNFGDMPASFKQISIPQNSKKLSVSICYNDMIYLSDIPYNSYGATATTYAEQLSIDYKFKLKDREPEEWHKVKMKPYVVEFRDANNDHAYDSFTRDVTGVVVDNGRHYQLVDDDSYYYIDNVSSSIESIILEDVEVLVKSTYVKDYTEQDDVAPKSPCVFYVKSDGSNGDPHGYYESFINLPSYNVELQGFKNNTWRQIGYISYSCSYPEYSTIDSYMSYIDNVPQIGEHKGYLVRDGFTQRNPNGLNLVTGSNINLDDYSQFRICLGAYSVAIAYNYTNIAYDGHSTITNTFEITAKVMVKNKEDE